MPHPANSPDAPDDRRARIVGRTAAALVTAALGASAALAIGACGEDREGSVENIGGGTTGTTATGATTSTAPTTTGGETTGGETTGGSTTPDTTGTTDGE